MRLDLTIVHLSPLVNSYKGRDYFSTFVFYSANLKDLTNLTEFFIHRYRSYVPPGCYVLDSKLQALAMQQKSADSASSA